MATSERKAPRLMTGLKRLVKDYEDARAKGFEEDRFRVSLYDEEGNGYWVWWVTIKGPPGSCYEGSEYDLKLWFSDMYPFIAPRAGMSTPIHHPNIDRSSYGIKLDYLRSQWNPQHSGINLIDGIIKALADPDPDKQRYNEGKHQCLAIANQFKLRPEEFKRDARRAAKHVVPLPGTSAFIFGNSL